MFRRPTTFVVGAGASAELGLPVGSELRNTIGHLVNISFEDGYSQTTGNPEICEALRLEVRQPSGHAGNINPYIHSARQMSNALPLSLSIDNYLETHQNDSKVVLVGKLAIAKAILGAESASKLAYDWREQDGPDLSGVSDTWLVRFFQMASAGVTVSQVGEIFKNITLIIFNYDRCVEHFIIHALKTYYGVDETQATAITATLRIFHPYGTVGPLAQQGHSGVRFGAEKQGEGLLALSRSIQTFSERIEDNDDLQNAREWVRTSEQIVFLGFAYHQQNLELIRVQAPSEITRVIGTSLGISPSDCEVIKEALPGYLHLHGASIEMIGVTSSAILEQKWLTLTA